MSPHLVPFFEELGIPITLPIERCLVEFPEASVLVVAEQDADAREHRLTPDAAAAWSRMKCAARGQKVELVLVSAFRTVQYQAVVVRRRLASGMSVQQAMSVLAPPGFSEHHSGRAVDISTTGSVPLREDFEQTEAFAWLKANASKFGYYMSFPRGNREGYAYEPWHWCFRSA